MKKSSKPLPLPTLKLSEPPGAVRPDGIQTLPLTLPAPGQSPVINKPKSNRIDVDKWVLRQAQSKLAPKDAQGYISWQTKNKLSP